LRSLIFARWVIPLLLRRQPWSLPLFHVSAPLFYFAEQFDFNHPFSKIQCNHYLQKFNIMNHLKKINTANYFQKPNARHLVHDFQTQCLTQKLSFCYSFSVLHLPVVLDKNKIT